jgi:hypothetical protein
VADHFDGVHGPQRLDPLGQLGNRRLAFLPLGIGQPRLELVA